MKVLQITFTFLPLAFFSLPFSDSFKEKYINLSSLINNYNIVDGNVYYFWALSENGLWNVFFES